MANFCQTLLWTQNIQCDSSRKDSELHTKHKHNTKLIWNYAVLPVLIFSLIISCFIPCSDSLHERISKLANTQFHEYDPGCELNFFSSFIVYRIQIMHVAQHQDPNRQTE